MACKDDVRGQQGFELEPRSTLAGPINRAFPQAKANCPCNITQLVEFETQNLWRSVHIVHRIFLELCV